MPILDLPEVKFPRWRCHIHEETRTTYQITLRNDEGEVVFQHNYCLQCYDAFLQRYLDILPIVKDNEDQERTL